MKAAARPPRRLSPVATATATARLLHAADNGEAARLPGLWFCIWRISLGARDLLDATLAPLHLRSRDFWLLAMVAAGPISQQELAALCGVDPSSMVALLDDLETRALVRRQRHPRDRRVHLIHLTEAGDKLYRAGLPLARHAEERQIASLSQADQRRLLELLRRLAQSVSA